ncbi:MAG: type I DNA topoisomerase [Patescibacteria group bacterium]|nr:type I DNA topoisomerase [Patescibacteria group bacterium]
MKNLVIVESPAKARTIQKILGRGFKVEASFGHVRDLPKSKLGVNVDGDFYPQYVIPTKNRKTVTKLRDLAKEAQTLYLATDEDREGEAIGWHLLEAMKVDADKAKRVAFHEITKEAVEEAFKHPRELDFDLVDAQQARRVLDRLVGYTLSPLLWKKIFRGLSAGRVQSVALRLVVEREREIQAFKPDEFWQIEIKFRTASQEEFSTQVVVAKDATIPTEAEATRLVEAVKAALEHAVTEVKVGERKRNPSPPFTTSTLQQQASNKLGFSVKKTMMVAQKLYEAGYITYMRTDSTNLSAGSIAAARDYVGKNFGKEYLPAKAVFYKTKTKGAQEAHEAIRPSNPAVDPVQLSAKLDEDQKKLYKLIWQRMMASQMNPAILATQDVVVTSGEVISKASGATVKFDGFARVLDKWPFTETRLPALEQGELLELMGVEPTQHFTEPPARYNEASLVKQLEAMGIGRPSTYAPTISTLIERTYVEKQQRALVPQEVGFLVNDFLVEHFPQIVDYNFTAEMEEGLDEVAEGKKEWVPLIKDFWVPFEKQVREKEAKVEKQTPSDEKAGKPCPLCGKDLIIKTGRFGRFLACSGFPECRYTEPMEGGNGTKPEVTDKKCKECGAPMLKRSGKFGDFYGCSNYPKCKHVENIASNLPEMKCPKCKEGKIVERRTKRGKVFYGCSKYPKCDFASWDKPLTTPCPTCKGMMVEKSKTGFPTCLECGFEIKE